MSPSQPDIMPDALRSLAAEIRSPDRIPALCLREAADMIERMRATLNHIATYPHITATAMRDAAREALK